MENLSDLKQSTMPDAADVVDLVDKSKMLPARVIVLVLENSSEDRLTEVVGIESAIRDFSDDPVNSHIPFTISGYVAWRQRCFINSTRIASVYVGQIY